MSYKPCIYCISKKDCTKFIKLREMLKGYNCRSMKIVCESFQDEYKELNRVIVTDLFEYGGFDNPILLEPIQATVMSISKHRNHIIVELDAEFRGEKRIAVKRKQVKLQQ